MVNLAKPGRVLAAQPSASGDKVAAMDAAPRSMNEQMRIAGVAHGEAEGPDPKYN
ncbi:hypothetical protein [Bradyrhizobium sp.]|uniref:hypothetical protein n=1 Tax=Bradyrhizobium sp. TaxID=376 RepID=UPI003C774379